MTYDDAEPVQLLVRNTMHGVASQVRIRSATLRFAA
jgi:ribosomal protein S28E/S33